MEIPLADAGDLDETYRAAVKAQREIGRFAAVGRWTSSPPGTGSPCTTNVALTRFRRRIYATQTTERSGGHPQNLRLGRQRVVMLAGGVVLVLLGLVGVVYGIYALVRGGRGQQGGGLGPIPERAIHAVAGVRMLVGGAVVVFLGVVAILSHFST